MLERRRKVRRQTGRGTGHSGFRFELNTSSVALTVHDRVITAIVFVPRIREFVGRDNA